MPIAAIFALINGIVAAAPGATNLIMHIRHPDGTSTVYAIVADNSKLGGENTAELDAMIAAGNQAGTVTVTNPLAAAPPAAPVATSIITGLNLNPTPATGS